MKIYVVTHKPFSRELPKDYEYIQVNAANNPHFCSLTDDTGDNISTKNPYYCELTATYWIWKNDWENDIVGLAHYRRFLTRNRFSSSRKYYLNGTRVEKNLRHCDFIATKLYKTKITVREHLTENVRAHDFTLLRETIQESCPEYLAAFDEVFAGHESYLLNVFICHKQNWNNYCAWLFPLLESMEHKVDMTGYTTQEQRLYGYLAERLFTVYAKHNSLRVKSYPTHIVGISIFTLAIHKIRRVLGLSKC